MSGTRSRQVRWVNWANTVTSEPLRVAHPSDAAEVAQIVRDARDDGLRVKPVGAGHSFTPVCHTDGVLLAMDRMRRITHVDHARRQGRAGAGSTLRELGPALNGRGLALPNRGDVESQTVSGATATGTHGTGGALKGLADAVVGLELVTGSGEIVAVDAASDPE